MGEVPDNPEPDAKRHARRLFDDVIEARALGDCARLKLAFGAMRGAPGPVRAAAERLLLAHGRARGLLELRGAAGVQKTPGGEAASLIATAQALRWQRHMGQWGEAQLAMGQAASDRANRPYFRAQLYFDHFFSALEGKRIMVVPGGREVTMEVDLQHDRQSTSVLEDGFSSSGGN